MSSIKLIRMLSLLFRQTNHSSIVYLDVWWSNLAPGLTAVRARKKSNTSNQNQWIHFSCLCPRTWNQEARLNQTAVQIGLSLWRRSMAQFCESFVVFRCFVWWKWWWKLDEMNSKLENVMKNVSNTFLTNLSTRCLVALNYRKILLGDALAPIEQDIRLKQTKQTSYRTSSLWFCPWWKITLLCCEYRNETYIMYIMSSKFIMYIMHVYALYVFWHVCLRLSVWNLNDFF